MKYMNKYIGQLEELFPFIGQKKLRHTKDGKCFTAIEWWKNTLLN